MIKKETGQTTMSKRIELRSPGTRYDWQKNTSRDQLKGGQVRVRDNIEMKTEGFVRILIGKKLYGPKETKRSSIFAVGRRRGWRRLVSAVFLEKRKYEEADGFDSFRQQSLPSIIPHGSLFFVFLFYDELS